MQIIITKDYHEMSLKASHVLIHQIKSKPDSVLALPTGDTPIVFYRILADAYKRKEVSFAKVKTFNLDEYVGLTSHNRNSYAFYMYVNLFSQVNLKKASCFIPDGVARELKAECLQYEKKIQSLGGIDLAVLGIGINGHIAFNEPGSSFNSKTRVVNLTSSTRRDNRHHFGEASRVPKKAVTMGLSTIMQAKKLILIASGPRKAEAINELVNGPVSKKMPASLLQTHDDVTLIIDEAAASKLRSSGYTDASLTDFTIYAKNSLPYNKNIVVISPHPDDSSISVGGTVSMLAKNNNVHIFVMTSGFRAAIPLLSKRDKIKLRHKEAIEEAKILGAKTHFLNLDFYESGKISGSDDNKLFKIINKLSPDMVFLSLREDEHPTHKLSTELTLKVLKKYVKHAKKIVETWYYETPWSLFTSKAFNTVVQIPSVFMKNKIQAVKCHKSQTQRTTFDQVAKAMSIMRGAIVPEQILGLYGAKPPKLEKHAEVFSVSRITFKENLVESFSGVRGIYGHDLNEIIAETYAFIFGDMLHERLKRNPVVVIGRDSRPSGRKLMQAMIYGLERAGCHVFKVGVATTPLVQFEVRNKDCDGGIIITASHNEPDWNGFKFLSDNGGVLVPDDMDELIKRYHSQNLPLDNEKLEEYIDYVFKVLGKKMISKIAKASLKVVVDPNGGAMIVLIKMLFERLGIKTVEINMDLGVFRHKVEPTKEALKHIGPIIRKNKADLGVAWDCDGDRVEIILSTGEIVSGHYVLALLADQILKETKLEKKIVISCATSKVVKDIAEKHSAKVYETDVGEANVIDKMYQVGAVVGGEGSCGGGIIPPSRCRDGVLTLLKVLGMSIDTKKSLHDILKTYPEYFTVQKNIKIDAKALKKIRKRITAYYKKYKMEKRGGIAGSIKIKIDNDSFVMFRPSKTEKDIMRIIVDSRDKSKTRELMNEALSI